MSDPSQIPFVPLYINGEWRPSSTGVSFSVQNSHTRAIATTAAAASAEDCVAAIEAAQRAFPAWEATPLQARRAIFLRAASVLETPEWRARATAAMLAETVGTPKFNAVTAAIGAAALQNIAGMVNELKGETFPSAVPGGQVFVQRRAHGVVYSVVPWNSPITLMNRAVGVPIICGNTVVARPSEHSPLTLSLIVKAFEEAGLPKGVLNFIPMSAEDTPKLTPGIISHPFVRKITFTGGDRVGRVLATEAGKHLKPCVFELGGKAPSVVLSDADPDAAARGIVFGGLVHSGQICMSTERVIVLRPVLEPLVGALKTHMSKLRVGDPENSEMSSLFTSGSADNIVSLIRDAREKGAELLFGEGEKRGDALLGPQLVGGVKPGTPLWERETFGPVLVLAVADTVDEAVELANATEYTLTASVWTNDVYDAIGIAMRLRAGAVNINGITINNEQGLGNAGLGGSSGYGRFDVENFTDKRMVTLHPKNGKYPLWNL
ncbi:aldehyde dehydrogenase [Gloeopeniophorella convolvens]|nr:aldehyde dehydrogenase [Gloeopeniophorella convolvens]